MKINRGYGNDSDSVDSGGLFLSLMPVSRLSWYKGRKMSVVAVALPVIL